MPVDAGQGGPPVPVEFGITEDSVWQMACGKDKWQDVDFRWEEPLFQALRDGVKELRLSTREWPEDFGYCEVMWYTIDLSDHTWITAKKDDERKQRQMRVVRLMKPTAVQGQTNSETPPPPNPLAEPAGVANTTMGS